MYPFSLQAKNQAKGHKGHPVSEWERKLNTLCKNLNIYISFPAATYKPNPAAWLLGRRLTQPHAILMVTACTSKGFCLLNRDVEGLWVCPAFFLVAQFYHQGDNYMMPFKPWDLLELLIKDKVLFKYSCFFFSPSERKLSEKLFSDSQSVPKHPLEDEQSKLATP